MLNPAPVGKAIADYFMDNAPAAGTPITRVELENLWIGAISLLYADLQANLGVKPGTFEVVTTAGGGTFPVIGVGGPAL